MSRSTVPCSEDVDATDHPVSSTGFLLILEPFESDMATVPNPIFHLT